MSDEHTPTTEVIRERATKHAAGFGFLQELSYEDQFDRWLEAHDREVAAEALEEAAEDCAQAFLARQHGEVARVAAEAIYSTLRARADSLRAEREGAGEGES